MSNQGSLILIHKPVGATPLEMIRRLRERYPQYKESLLGYAGRLDPMAEGLLLILEGDMNSKRKDLEKKDKTYLCEALFGISTDTYDVLGKITSQHLPCDLEYDKLKSVLETYIGKQIQQYPPYSSPRVKGHPLFWWARQGRIDEIDIPSKEVAIYSVSLSKYESVRLETVKTDLLNKLSSVKGEFRQQEIIEDWKIFLEKNASKTTILCTLEISCSSGTYMRSLIHDLGQKISCGALAFSIKRTAIGTSTVSSALLL